MNSLVEPVSLENHKHIRIANSYRFEHMRGAQFVPVGASELGYASTCYPIFFIKDTQTAKFFPVALFGIEKGENLFYSEQGSWQAAYIPRLMEISPFSIGSVARGDEPEGAVVCLDRNSPYVVEYGDEGAEQSGRRLFDEDGQETDYLLRVRNSLADLYQDKSATMNFVQRLLEAGLLKSVRFNLAYKDGARRAIDGIYAIKAEGLAGLDTEMVQEFYQKGYFAPIYSMLNSQHNLYDLVKKKADLHPEEVNPVTSLQVVDH